MKKRRGLMDEKDSPLASILLVVHSYYCTPFVGSQCKLDSTLLDSVDIQLWLKLTRLDKVQAFVKGL